MRTLWQDLRYEIRALGRTPGFTTVAVLTLALGIGANTAIFTLMDTLLWRSLPVRDPQELALVMDQADSSLRYMAYPQYERLCEESRSFSGLFASAKIRTRRLLVTGPGGQAEWVPAQAVSGNFFEVLGVRAACGRSLMPSDDRPRDCQPVAVISYGFWQRRFGLDAGAIGSTITLDDVPFTIVGVAPQGLSGFEVGDSPDLWWPICLAPLIDREEDALTSQSFWVRLVGRLKPGVTLAQASVELNTIYQRILEEESVQLHFSEEQRRRHLEWQIEVQPGAAGWMELRQEFGRPLRILMGMVGLVLLVACANLAGLLLTRGTTRRRELNVRVALGASRWALGRQCLTESLLLALAGGVLGLLLAQWGVRLLAGYLPGYGVTLRLDLTPDLRVLTFTFLVSASIGVLFGLVPAWRGSRIDLTTALRDRAGPWIAGSGQRWGRRFVVAQIAVSGCLLIGAGLFVRTVQKLDALDCGFNREHLMTFELEVRGDRSPIQRANLCHQVLQRLESLPRVRCAALSSTRSLTGADGGWGSWKVAADGAGPAAGEGVQVRSVCVTPRYFETMGIPLLKGREFLPQDESAARGAVPGPIPPVVIVDETLARRLFGNDDPVGRYLRSLHRSIPPLEIIGVAGNTRHYELRSRPSITLYNLETNYSEGFLFFYVRALADPAALLAGIRELVRQIDPTAGVKGLQMMEEVVNNHLFQERAISHMASLFSLSALLLACLGLYGTLSYNVARRRQEMGVRMALGARAGDVLWLVVRQGMGLAAAGCTLGLLLALVLTRLISGQLYGVTSLDPLTFAVGGLVLLLVALVACYLPARRAAKTDPMTALRYE